jgi:hypothetical protein
VSGLKRPGPFFASLGRILPPSSYLVFEGTSIAPEVRRLLESAAIPEKRHITRGTIWPRPTTFHVAASPALLSALVELSARHAEPELCDHFHAYDDSEQMLQWYDAFTVPFFVAFSVEESALRAFCEVVGATYKKWSVR